MYNLIHAQDRVRRSIQKLHRYYRTGIGVFMNETDVQCMLYRFLCDSFKTRAYRTKVKGINRAKNKNYSYNEIRTTPVHAEICSATGKRNKFVDLCIVNPRNVTFRISEKTFDPSNGKFRTHGAEWSDWEQIGIEIKLCTYIKDISKKNFFAFHKSLVRDLKKLTSYRRGWLVFVDQLGVYRNKTEFRRSMTKALHDANPKRLKTTLNVYYLSFGKGKAWSWKSKWLTRDS